MRVTTRWSGFTGSPGFTVMHFRDFDTEGNVTPEQVNAAITRTRSFWTTVHQRISSTVTLQPQSEVEILEDSTGELVDVVQATAPNAPILGTASGSVAGPAGAVINWRTSSIRNGRRIRGRTFLVPLAVTAYEANGSLVAAAQSEFLLAATNLVDSTGTPDLGVFARPTGPDAADGQWVRATGANVPDMVAVLRSRRD